MYVCGSIRETRTREKRSSFLRKEDFRPKLRENFLTVLATDEIAINSNKFFGGGGYSSTIFGGLGGMQKCGKWMNMKSLIPKLE